MKTLVSITLLYLVTASSAAAQQPRQIFDQKCATCHGAAAVERAPEAATLRQMTPERIYSALTSGSMRVQAEGLPDETKRGIAEFLSDRKLSSGEVADARMMSNRCPSGPSAFNASNGPSWNGWGVTPINTRFQPAEAAGLSRDQFKGLKVKWAFGVPGAAAVYGQPSLVGGRLFFGADTGYVYSLDAASGCVYWSFQAQAGVRTAVSVGSRGGSPSGHAAYFGDLRGNVFAIDAGTGELLWKVAADDHSLTRITGTPTLYGNRLYVPVASMEEGSASFLNYPCCTFRGSVLALDAETGKQLWKTYTISETPKPTKKNSKGVQLWGPAGGAVWGAPTIDIERRAVYVTTGNAYTAPAAGTTDAIMALDMDTGKVLWSVQDIEKDAWIALCGPFASPDIKPSENCPAEMGPDYDFSSSVILKKLPDGRRILIAGQKSGIVWAHDPDRMGALLWKTTVAPKPPGPQGELVWGGAADDEKVYFGLNSGGIVALRLDRGTREWLTPMEPAVGRARGNNAAITLTAGVVMATGWDGVIRALSADKGEVLWEYNTVREFETVNRVAAKGGSMGAQGATIARGMVFVGSGYIGVQNGIAGNALLAFSTE